MRIDHIVTLATIVVVTIAKPHGHAHRRAHAVVARDARPDRTVYAPAVIRTITKFELEGHDISEKEVRQGLLNGTLQWARDGTLATLTRGSVALPTSSPLPTATPEEKPQPAETHSVLTLSASKSTEQSPNPQVKPVQSADKPSDSPSTQAAPSPSPVAGASLQIDTTSKTADQLVDKDGKCSTCDIEFPSGTLPCSVFPNGYGAMPITHENLGGWSGIQDPGSSGNAGFDDIRTVVSSSCIGGSCCTPGSFCSYGCPNPYLKLSFPKKQGVTGQSVGGLYCNANGMLEMADGSLGKTLCGPDSAHMKVKVQNKLQKSVSICRTDYPGTESMTFPLTLGPGETRFLANPDQSKYFFWKGESTSAHYYVNSQGVPEEKACTWAKQGAALGNWAPAIIGTSWDDMNMDTGFTSLKQNELNTDTALDYSITFEGEGVNCPCRYINSSDQYCEGTECWKDRTRGCTASTKAGSTLTIVLSD